MDEKVVEQSMEIITYSGNGRALVINALRRFLPKMCSRMLR